MKRKRTVRDELPTTSIEDLPDDIVRILVELVVPKGRDSLRLVLRSVSKRWNRLAQKEGPYETMHWHCGSASILLLDAAGLGHVEICRLAHSWDPGACAARAGVALGIAAASGHEDACRFTKSIGADDYVGMLWTAVRANRPGTCALAKAWGTQRVYPEDILEYATAFGNLEMCELAVEWGARKFEDALKEGIVRGHRRICEFAIARIENRDADLATSPLRSGRSRGDHRPAVDFDRMLVQGAKLGHAEICELAIERGSGEIRKLMIFAAIEGHDEIFRLGLARGATENDVTKAISIAQHERSSTGRRVPDWLKEFAADHGYGEI